MNYSRLTEAMGNLNEQEVMDIVREIVDGGGEGVYQALDAFQQGMEIISSRFDSCEYFVGDLIFAGELMTHAVNLLHPVLQRTKSNGTHTQKIIICTVEGDLHDIGKNIVKTVLEGRGIRVIDLGVNLSPNAVVERAISEKVAVIVLSGVLTFSLESMRLTVEAFKKAGIRDKVRILVGGSCVNESTFKQISADAWAVSPKKSADICCNWLNESL